MLGNILAVGIMSMGMGMLGVKDETQMKANAQETIVLPGTYTGEQIKNLISYYCPNQGDTVNNIEATGTYTSAGGGSFTSVSMSYNNNGGQIVYQLTAGGPATIQVLQDGTLNPGYSTITFTSYPEEWTYLLAGEQPPQPMGQSIIGSIASGLGIIASLATTFLTGFGNLFYSSGALTPFAIFSLVMLGVAVSFAVVKLVLNLIRNNTGA